jgi:hypothetical protein
MSELKKLPSVLSTEDLIELIENEDGLSEKSDLSDFKNDILSFISSLNIEPGEYKVNKNTLYLIYKAWSNSPINKSPFISQIALHLPSTPDTKYVLINKNSIKLTHEAYVRFKKQTHVLKTTKHVDDFNDFLKYFSIESGTYFFELDFLYLLYTRYAESKGIGRPFSRVSFEKYCRVNFLSKQLKTGPAFGIKPNVDNFFEKGELKKLRRNHGKKKKTVKKK